MNFDHERIVQQRRRRHQNEIRSPESDWRYAMAAKRVRRDKAALSSGCKARPAKRSSRKQPEQSWR